MGAEDDGPVTREHLRQVVMFRVLRGVFRRQFLPGSRLVAQHLCEAYHVSQTPVREAIQELEGLGIVDVVVNRGAVVRPFGPQQVREIGQVRRVLEVEATRCACGRIPEQELRDVCAELERVGTMLSTAEQSESGRAADNRLHGLIRSHCGNDRLALEIGRYLTLSRALRDVSHERDACASTGDMPEQHLAIARALLAGDAEEAAQAMDSHLRVVSEILAETVFAEPTPPDPERAGAGAGLAKSC